MSIELEVQNFPKGIVLKDNFEVTMRPLERDDEKEFHQFFLDVPGEERMFIKHRVTEPQVIGDWCQNIDLGRNFPLLAIADQRIVGCATLHQQLGGWKRHVGRISALVLPQYRGRGLARTMITEIRHVSRNLGLERIEAEFFGEQVAAIKMFAMLGFINLARFEDYVKDMQGVTHDYVLMSLSMKVDEEYAGVGG
jgi:RimJ/RimL family protein N-acetyltransferase